MTEHRCKLADVMVAVCGVLHVTRDELCSPEKTQPLALYRQIAFYLAREMTTASYTMIGDYFGDRDHTTVMHACEETVRRLTEGNTVVVRIVNICRPSVNAIALARTMTERGYAEQLTGTGVLAQTAVLGDGAR